MPQTNGYCLLDKWLAQKTNCLVKKTDCLFPSRLSLPRELSLVLPNGAKQCGFDGEHEPAPMQLPLLGDFLDLLEYDHSLRAMHVSIASRHRNGLAEGV